MPQIILPQPLQGRLLLDFPHLGNELLWRGAHVRLAVEGGEGQAVRAQFLRLRVDAFPAVECRVALFQLGEYATEVGELGGSG